MARRLRVAALLAPLLLAATLAVAEAQSCKTYTSKGLIQPAVGSLQDVIVVQDGFVVGEASVTLEVSHRRIGALKIMLGAQPFSSAGASAASHPQIVLKSHGLGRRGDNMYRTTFLDSAATAFPVNASYAPFTGSFRPVQKLAFLIDGEQQVAGAGGSQGLWTLTVADVAPNNTLREIALNGWSLVLCPRGSSASQTDPDVDLSPGSSQAGTGAVASPAPSPTPAPAPAVSGFSGPPEATAAPSPPVASIPTATPTTIGGWTVVMKGSPPGQVLPGTAAPSPAGAPTTLPAQPPLQQLLAQRPMLALLEQQIAAIASGMGGNCDAACQQAKMQLWAAAAFGLYVHRKHAASGEHAHPLMDKMKELLPGDGKPLSDLLSWMEGHHTELKGLSQFMRDSLKLPALSVNGEKLTLGSGREGLQQLTALAASLPKDTLQKLMGSFAAAGERLAQLASGLASGSANNLQALMSALTSNLGGGKLPTLGSGPLAGGLPNLQGTGALSSLFAASADKMAAALASGANAKQAAVGNLAGGLDAKLTGINSFFNGLSGAKLDEVTAAGLAEMSDSLAALFDFSGFS